MSNLLLDTDDRLTFAQYDNSEHWTGTTDEDGNRLLTTMVETVADVPYELDFNLAANLAAQVQSVTVDILIDGEVIGTVTHDGGMFETYTLSFVGTGTTNSLQFRIFDAGGSGNDAIDTSGVIPSQETTLSIMGQDITVDGFAPGQNFIYQVLNGQLVKFDLETRGYTETEMPAAVNVNAIGYSNEFNLIYGLARSDGVDALGQDITRNDVIAMDATGATYRVAAGEMGSYIGDVDEQGNLWTFSGNLRTAVVYDLSEVGPDGSLVSQVVELVPNGISTRGLADLAYDAETQTFYGVAHGGSTGAPGALVSVDISQVSMGGEPIIAAETLAGTIVDGEVKTGIPASAYGATMVDADGNIYAGANATDHDLDPSTGNSGGFYRITRGPDGALYMELLADAPVVSSNDGAMDTRGVDPFLGIDQSSSILLRSPSVSIAVAEDDEVTLAAKGVARVVDLFENDEVSEGESLRLTQLNGEAATVGTSTTLSSGEQVRYLGNGLLEVTPASDTRDVTVDLTYTVENDSGITDTATVTIHTSPVQGTGQSDHMVGYTDQDGTQIDGADGLDDVILGFGGNDKIFAGHGDDDIYGGTGNDFIRAQAGDDVLFGDDGRDTLDGGSGADSMYGGTGNDLYFIDQVGDFVSEENGDGTDTVKSRISHILADGFENLWLQNSAQAVNGTGNDARNMIVGNTLANRLEGLGGHDNLIGRDGDDSIYGGEGNDKLHGNDGADMLDGQQGNDKLHGGTGNDTVFGGDGNDILCPGLGDDVMYGGEGNDMYGGEGNDLLSGNAGADTAYGGLGNDVYKVSDSLDTIVEYAGEGHDVVHAKADITLSEHVEDVFLFGTDHYSATGNDAANRLLGNGGNNTLIGLAGNDHIDGRAGDDIIDGGLGNDKLQGGTGADQLTGGVGADTVLAGSGDDQISGGQGNDLLFGGEGADTFLFRSGDGHDTIGKFDTAADTLQLLGITEDQVSWTVSSAGLSLHYGDDEITLSGLNANNIEDVNILFLNA